jgi:DNA-binding transcriptional MocR family regulator
MTLCAGHRDGGRQGGFRAAEIPGLRAGLGAGEKPDQRAHADDHRQFAAQPDRQPADAADLEKLAELCAAPTSSSPTRSTSTSCSTANATPACAASELAARSIVVSSFGKTYHITGWKIGYVVGPAALMAEFRKVHQFNVFTVHAPSQLAIAEYMQDAARHLRLAAFYQEKRDFFRR